MNRDLRKPETESINPDDLDWLAFRYISDELESAEREEFEARLETDELAQQAIVDAVLQTQLIYASKDVIASANPTVSVANPTVSVAKPTSSVALFGRPSVLLAAAAALLLLIAGWNFLPTDNSNVTATTPTSSANDSELAVAWADTFSEELTLDGIVEDFFDGLEPENEYAEDTTLASDSESNTEPNGDWMFVALTELESDNPMEGL